MGHSAWSIPPNGRSSCLRFGTNRPKPEPRAGRFDVEMSELSADVQHLDWRNEHVPGWSALKPGRGGDFTAHPQPSQRCHLTGTTDARYLFRADRTIRC